MQPLTLRIGKWVIEPYSRNIEVENIINDFIKKNSSFVVCFARNDIKDDKIKALIAAINDFWRTI